MVWGLGSRVVKGGLSVGDRFAVGDGENCQRLGEMMLFDRLRDCVWWGNHVKVREMAGFLITLGVI